MIEELDPFFEPPPQRAYKFSTMLANTEAVTAGAKTIEITLDGAPWTQPTFEYQVKTVGWVQGAYFDLKPVTREQVDAILTGRGREVLFVK